MGTGPSRLWARLHRQEALPLVPTECLSVMLPSAVLLNESAMRHNLWKPRWTAGPPAVDKNLPRWSLTDHDVRSYARHYVNSYWTNKERKLLQEEKSEHLFFLGGDLNLIITYFLRIGHTVRFSVLHRLSIMLLPSALVFTFSCLLAPLFLCYLPQVSAQKSGSRVSVCMRTLLLQILLYWIFH